MCVREGAGLWALSTPPSSLKSELIFGVAVSTMNILFCGNKKENKQLERNYVLKMECLNWNEKWNVLKCPFQIIKKLN